MWSEVNRSSSQIIFRKPSFPSTYDILTPKLESEAAAPPPRSSRGNIPPLHCNATHGTIVHDDRIQQSVSCAIVQQALAAAKNIGPPQSGPHGPSQAPLIKLFSAGSKPEAEWSVPISLIRRKCAELGLQAVCIRYDTAPAKEYRLYYGYR